MLDEACEHVLYYLVRCPYSSVGLYVQKLRSSFPKGYTPEVSERDRDLSTWGADVYVPAEHVVGEGAFLRPFSAR